MKAISAAVALQRLAVATCAASLLFVAAQAEQRPTLTRQVPAAVSSGVAQRVGRLPAAQHLSLAISLPLQNQSELADLLQQLYDPQNPSYHKYLSVREFTGRFGPAETDYAALLRFAQTNHLVVMNAAANRMIVDLDGQAADTERAFHLALGRLSASHRETYILRAGPRTDG